VYNIFLEVSGQSSGIAIDHFELCKSGIDDSLNIFVKNNPVRPWRMTVLQVWVHL